MALWWKRGKVDVTKTRSAARGRAFLQVPSRILSIGTVLIIWSLVSLACSGGFITTGELTQTAQAPLLPQTADPTMTAYAVSYTHLTLPTKRIV